MYGKNKVVVSLGCGAALVFAASSAWAFDSGSTGTDGAFNPTVNTQVALPASGILSYTSFNIPTGVTVTFQRNTTNTPVVILVQGDATVAGIIDIRGGAAAASGAAGNGNVGDDGVPGLGGPGGYNGGRGGPIGGDSTDNRGGAGLGPGGGMGGKRWTYNSTSYKCGGGGAGFTAIGHPGGGSPSGSAGTCGAAGYADGGPQYGANELLPLIGGSGGGGGTGYSNYIGGGGGGGGGAVLLAASGTLTVSGSILADGGSGGASSGQNSGGAGGSGSGGAIKLMAATVTGNGPISAMGGPAITGTLSDTYMSGGSGAVGRIRIEAETINRASATTPPYTFGQPGPIFVAGLPTLRIASVGGVAAPAQPTGSADIALPENTPNPVSVEVATTGVPVGNTVTVTVLPATGSATSFVSNALAGSSDAATASVGVTLPAGPSTLMATVSYSVAAGAPQQTYWSRFTDGEKVASVDLRAVGGGLSQTRLVTVSGREVDVPGLLAAP